MILKHTRNSKIHIQNNEGWNGQNSQTGRVPSLLPYSPAGLPQQLLAYKIERAGVSRFEFSPLAQLFKKCNGL